METTSLAYYAAVCGVLGVISPWLGSFLVRLVLGAIVGLVAAGALPFVQDWLSAAGYVAAS